MSIKQRPPDLASIRRQRGTSLHNIAQATKIGVSYLEAIEDGRFEKLPGGIYSISYIRQYAHAIEFDEDDLLQYYYSKAGIEPEPASQPPVANGAKKTLVEMLRGPLLRVLG